MVFLRSLLYTFGPVDGPEDPTDAKEAVNLVSAKIRFAANQGERFYGLGEHRTGKLQNKPIFINFQHSQIYTYSGGGDISIPFYTSSLGYGFLWNLPSFGYVNVSNTGTEWYSNSTYQLDFWVGTTPLDHPSSRPPYGPILSRYVDATGHPPVMPDFATGFWQCKNRYRNQTQVLDIAEGYIGRGVPLSMIVIDYMHWAHMGDWSFVPQCWPNPSQMTQTLHMLGVGVMVSVWPLVDPNSVNFAAMEAAGYLVKNRTGQAYPFHPPYLYDPFNPAARQFVFKQLHAGYYRHGISVYWLDADEPERFTPDQSGQYYYHSGRDLQVGMAYPRMHQQMVWDGLQSLHHPEVFTLSRSAWAGSARYGGAVWSGDIPSTFDELSKQVRVAQNMAMSGIYWWTTDIGGYIGANIYDPQWRELIVRWYQFGAFCPVFRTHGWRQPTDPDAPCGGSGGPNEIWEFGNTAYGIISKIIVLREQLRPYVATHMKIAATHGIPILRPMVFDCMDAACVDAEDQFMFGPDWLVAPVTTYQASSRSVYLPTLPASRLWVHYYSNASFSGGQRITIKTPLDTFPLFYRLQVE
jgi:alpha-D-xyloside xylohydrolase